MCLLQGKRERLEVICSIVAFSAFKKNQVQGQKHHACTASIPLSVTIKGIFGIHACFLSVPDNIRCVKVKLFFVSIGT